jgi:hypothetical protein
VATVAAVPRAQPEPIDRSVLARYEGGVALVLCGVLAWIAQFHHLKDFGLYEDDYFFISQAMGKDPSYLATRFHIAFTALPQGRPFGFFLPDLLSFVGDKIGGLTAIYVLGFLVVTLNTFLCFRLLRTRVPLAPAIVGASVFCLFPSDTTKIFLTHDFQLQPSLTFALLAGLAYAGNRLPLSYLLSAGALLSYENGFLALFGLPLLLRPWDRRLPRTLVLHVAALIGVLVVVVALRVVVGENRATSSAGSITQIVPLVLGSLVLGPARSVAGMFYGPLKAIRGADVEYVALVALAVVGFAALLWRTGRGLVRTAWREPLQVMGAGSVMVVLAYLLAFTHFPPNALVGRGTSVHLGATFGMAVLAAGVAWLLLAFRPRVAVAVLATYLALAVGYYVTIERDFMHSWQLQRTFWQQVAACCSDLQDGTVLIYVLDPADEPTFIFTNSWSDPLVLTQTFAFPPDWTHPPRLFSLTEWQSRVEREGDHLRWWVPGASWDEHWETFPQGNVILLRKGADGSLQRVTGAVPVAGTELQLKSISPGAAWPPAQLYAPLQQ